MTENEEANRLRFDNVVGTVQQGHGTMANANDSDQHIATIQTSNDTSPHGYKVFPVNRVRLRSEMQGQGGTQHFLIHGIPHLPLSTAPRIMDPNEAVMRGMLPQSAITVPPCGEVKTRHNNPCLSLAFM